MCWKSGALCPLVHVGLLVVGLKVFGHRVQGFRVYDFHSRPDAKKVYVLDFRGLIGFRA